MKTSIYFDKVKEYVDRSYGQSLPHFEKTVYWIKYLFPKATDEMKVAAYSHDIERAFRNTSKSRIKSVEDYTDESFLKYHQERGAELMSQFLLENGASKSYADEVYRLISKHEVGGDKLQDILMNADSLSFFETSVENFVKKKAVNEGYKPVKQKLDWMFERMNITKARTMAEPLYTKWVVELDMVFESV